jgi:hypothetical protein
MEEDHFYGYNKQDFIPGKGLLTLPCFEEEHQPERGVSSGWAPATELQRRTLPPDAKFLNPIAGIHRVIIPIDPSAKQSRHVRSIWCKEKGNRDTILLERPTKSAVFQSMGGRARLTT